MLIKSYLNIYDSMARRRQRNLHSRKRPLKDIIHNLPSNSRTRILNTVLYITTKHRVSVGVHHATRNKKSHPTQNSRNLECVYTKWFKLKSVEFEIPHRDMM